MKSPPRIFAGLCLAVLGMLPVLLAGCHTSEPVFMDIPGMPQPTNAPGGDRMTGPGRKASQYIYSEVIHVGDVVVVAFTGLSTEPPIPTHAETVRDDGTLTPPFIGSVTAANKSPGQLQKELQVEYEKRYKNIVVTVRLGDRFFYVDGEVIKRGPITYPGQADIVTAISAAGGFTEFANKKKVRLIHPNNKTEIINYVTAMKESGSKYPVYPGDKIYVPRSIW